MKVYVEYSMESPRVKSTQPKTVSVDTLEDLLKFMKKEDHHLIIKHNEKKEGCDFVIEVYNGWRE